MPVPAKKLKALVDQDAEKSGKKKKRPDEEEEDKDKGDVDDADLQKYVDEEGERVNNGKQDKKLRKLMKGFDPEKNPPAWVAHKAKWERAKEAVDPEGDGADKYDEPYAVVAHVYRRMGGGIKTSKKDE